MFCISACNCELAGSLNEGECDGRTDEELGLVAGRCVCKTNADGFFCDQCMTGYYNLSEENPDGCTRKTSLCKIMFEFLNVPLKSPDMPRFSYSLKLLVVI